MGGREVKFVEGREDWGVVENDRGGSLGWVRYSRLAATVVALRVGESGRVEMYDGR